MVLLARCYPVSAVDFEDSYISNLCHSVGSIDEMLASEDSEQSQEAWKAELADRIEEILDRKRSSLQGRETALMAYARILTARYSEEEIRGKETELVTSFLKSIKAETSEKETILGMKGLLPSFGIWTSSIY